MALTDISAMIDHDPVLWARFGARLRELGLGDAALGRLLDVGKGFPESLKAALRVWHARRIPGPLAKLVRMLVLRDPVPGDEARVLLGGALVSDLLAVGFLVERDGGLVAAFLGSLVGKHYLVCDEQHSAPEAVMGPGETTADLLLASLPDARLGSVLDLGCGAGTIAIALAPFAARVVATDVNDRAVALGRINAAINGTSNVEFRSGSGFAPVAGERFDLIVSQPPFVARPDDAPERVFLFGGRRGDELALAILAATGAHLTPRGRAMFLLELPVLDDDPPQRRVWDAVGDGFDVMLLSRAKNLDVHCMDYACAAEPGLGPTYEEVVVRAREHLERRGILGLSQALVVIEPRVAAEPLRVDIPLFARTPEAPRPPFIEERLAAHRLLAEGRGALADAPLVVPEGTAFVEDAEGRVHLRFADARQRADCAVSRDVADLMEAVHDAPTTGEAVTALAGGGDAAPIWGAIEFALREGILAVDG